MAKILIADDEPHIIRVIKMQLIKAGHQIEMVSNGVDALTKIQESEPDILITDIQMPRMTGKELCQKIVEIYPERKFRIFVLTAKSSMDHRVWTKEISNLVFVEKPISLRKLIAEIDLFLEERGS